MATRLTPNGTLAPSGNPNGVVSRPRSLLNGSPTLSATANDDSDQRPSSAPGRRNGSATLETRDDSHPQGARRPVKPLLLRSKSEYASRPYEEPEATEEEIPEWGARHGFEDHYQSEDIISQLANVSFICSCSRHPAIWAPLGCATLRSSALPRFRGTRARNFLLRSVALYEASKLLDHESFCACTHGRLLYARQPLLPGHIVTPTANLMCITTLA